MRQKIVTLLAASVFSVLTVRSEAPDRWRIDGEAGIVSDPVTLTAGAARHADHLEMGGRTVDAIVEWSLTREGVPAVSRLVRFPLLRRAPDDTHSSFSHRFDGPVEAGLLLDDAPAPALRVTRVGIREGLTIEGECGPVSVRRTVFPAAHLPALLERWVLTNRTDRPVTVVVPDTVSETAYDVQTGKWAPTLTRAAWVGSGRFTLAPGESRPAGLVFSAREGAVGATPADAAPYPDIEAEYAARRALADRLDATLRLETPDPVLNRMFAMAKLRSVEAVLATRGGLMQGPGGYHNFLGAVWCNDNAEYMAPYHPYLGEPAGLRSGRDGYALYARYMNDAFKPLPSSIIAEGRDVWQGAGDRGDAAMLAQGASRFALASGDPAVAREVWPLIDWCLEYCERKKTAAGVIASDSDELEGRFSSGKTNLATSALTYDALVSAAHLARELGVPGDREALYAARAAALRGAIERHFGADVAGFATYRYHEGLGRLRAWICLPLAFGILDRAPGTLDALYSPALWTDDGLRTDALDKTFWDRSTLFALRATFIAGDTERGLDRLTRYSRRRLLGDHVPYAVEAYPEGGRSHLSGESCLYARIVIEGLFGIRPTGLRAFTLTPRLPAAWPVMTLRDIRAHGFTHTIRVSRESAGVRVLVTDAAGRALHDRTLPAGTAHAVRF